MAIPPLLLRRCLQVSIILLTSSLFLLIFGGWSSNSSPTLQPLPLPLDSTPLLYPRHLQLIDLKDVFYLNNNDVCHSGRDKVLAVVLVHTHPSNVEVRDVIRQGISQSDLKDIGLRRVFLMARADHDQTLYKKVSQHVIDNENERHRDIVQGSFQEHYHNLTYKHIMGLQWGAKFCPQAKFIIKMDDDIVVDLFQFRDLLKYRFEKRRNLILGLLQVEARPVRNPKSKWYVSVKEFPNEVYANFVSGWAYAMTMDAVSVIVNVSAQAPYFWIDDVHVTGTLAAAVGVKREGLNMYFTIHSDHLRCCVQMPQYKEYMCDFIAGPSEGSLSLAAKVLSHAQECFVMPCRKRPKEQSVAKACVITDAPPLMPVSKGRGEIIKIYRRHDSAHT